MSMFVSETLSDSEYRLSLRCPDFMYGPLRFTRTDLVAVTIQRGRDFGLRSYTEVRNSLDLPPVGSFDDLNPELSSSDPKVKPTNQSSWEGQRLTNVLGVSLSRPRQLLRDIAELYNGDISKLELFPGGLLESSGSPGPVFSAIILDQFERIRNGDRFWFENRENRYVPLSQTFRANWGSRQSRTLSHCRLFTEEEIQKIRRTTLHHVLVAVTSAEATDLQKDVFFWKDGKQTLESWIYNIDMMKRK